MKKLENINELSEKESDSIRDKYINSFLNCNKEGYKDDIETLKKHTDGLCYDGYMWDYLKTPEVISLSSIINNLIDSPKEIYILWDLHSNDKIWIENYWHYEKKSVLSLNSKDIQSLIKILPEDIYIFDNSYKWSFVITHEQIDNKRWCLAQYL